VRILKRCREGRRQHPLRRHEETAQEIIKEEASRAGIFYVNQRWLGGMLTNYQTIKKSIKRLEDIEKMKENGTMAEAIEEGGRQAEQRGLYPQ